VGWHPLSSRAAADLVHRSPFEPRPANRRTNHTVPSKRLLLAWRKRNTMPYRRFVNGRFKGRTDEIIQWAAYKWGLDENVLRAAAVAESWWRQSSAGDGGDSFGLFRVRRPFHCRGKCAIARRSTSFNADYYAGTIRAYYDGMMTWLNTVERGAEYAAGDLWGSLGAWFAGRWWTQPASGTSPRSGGASPSGPGSRASSRARSPRLYLMKRISEYFGSGQRSSATTFSSLSAASRTLAIAASWLSRA
jgi:hypothetical protein